MTPILPILKMLSVGGENIEHNILATIHCKTLHSQSNQCNKMFGAEIYFWFFLLSRFCLLIIFLQHGQTHLFTTLFSFRHFL